MVKFRNSGTKGAVVKSRVDITLTFKELQDNVLLDDIFAGGRAFGTGVSFSVGNTHIIIDTGDSEVMSGDIPVGGLAYHLQRNQKAKHSVPLLLLATRLLNEQRHNQRNFFGGGYACGYASYPYDADNPVSYQEESRVGNTHIIIIGGTATEAVVGGGKVRGNTESSDHLEGLS